MAPPETPTKMPSWQRTKKPTNCAVCGKISRFNFNGHNVHCCEGCKQFFRRVVAKQTQYLCTANRNCDITKKKCRGCRLDKCLQLGMDPTFVKAENENEVNRMLESLELRRNALLNFRKDSLVNGAVIEESNQLDYFTQLICAHRRIFDRCFELPDAYLSKFSKIEDVLNGQDNILSLYKCLSPYPERWPEVKLTKLFREMLELRYGNLSLHPLIRKGHIVYQLMAAGILKATPAFNQLAMEDRIILVRELGHQMNNFTHAYYSLKIGELSVSGPSGLSYLGVISDTYKEAPRVVEIAKKVFVHPIEAFRCIPMLDGEEFALLIAIMCSNSAISGLSPHAKDILYREQCHYSQLLLKHCQHKMGNGAKGAQRYGECLQLIESAFQAARNYELMNTYIEVFLTGKDFYEGVFPEELKKLVK